MRASFHLNPLSTSPESYLRLASYPRCRDETEPCNRHHIHQPVTENRVSRHRICTSGSDKEDFSRSPVWEPDIRSRDIGDHPGRCANPISLTQWFKLKLCSHR